GRYPASTTCCSNSFDTGSDLRFRFRYVTDATISWPSSSHAWAGGPCDNENEDCDQPGNLEWVMGAALLDVANSSTPRPYDEEVQDCTCVPLACSLSWSDWERH